MRAVSIAALPSPSAHTVEAPFTWEDVDRIRESSLAARKSPPGAFTVAEYCQRYKLKRDAAKTELTKLVKAGRLQTSRALHPAQDGRVTEQQVYYP